MKAVSRASSINSTKNAAAVEQEGQLRVAHKAEEDDAYNARIDRKVRHDIRAASR